MADYYPVLKRAISSLPTSNGDARRMVYEKARAALLRQLQSYDPPLSQNDITDQRLALEECIRRIEGEVAGAALGLGADDALHPPVAPPRPPATPVAPAADGRAAGAHPSGVQASSAPASSAPVSAAPVSGERGTGNPAPPPAGAISPEPERGDADKARRDVEGEQPRRGPPPTGAHQSPPPPPPGVTRQPPRPLSGEPRSEPGRPPRGPLAPETGRQPPAERTEPGFLDRPLGAPVPPPPRPGEGRRGEAVAENGAAAGAPLGHDRATPEEDEAPPPLIRRPPVKQKRGGGTAVFVAIAIVLLAVAGAAAIGWQQRESLLALWSDPDPVTVPGTDPEIEQDTPQVEVAAPPADGLDPKIEDRLPQEGEGSPVAPDARPVQTVQVDPPPEIDFPPAGVATDVPAPAPAPGTDTAAASTAPAAETGEATQPAGVAPSTGVQVAQRAILYEEPIPGSDGARVDGRVLWSFVEEPVLPGEPAVPQLRAVVEVPDRNMTMTLSIRRNTDDTLPASHVAEVRFALPPDFPGRSIDTTPGLILKPTEDARGDPLVGAVAKVADNLFWVALSGSEQETLKNVALMRDRQWVDVPIRYGNRRRAILTFEKGMPGERVVQQALQAWSD